MIVLVPINSELVYPEILTRILGDDGNAILDDYGNDMYSSNKFNAIHKTKGSYTAYDMQPSYEQSEAILSEGGFIFVDKAELRIWLNRL